MEDRLQVRGFPDKGHRLSRLWSGMPSVIHKANFLNIEKGEVREITRELVARAYIHAFVDTQGLSPNKTTLFINQKDERILY